MHWVYVILYCALQCFLDVFNACIVFWFKWITFCNSDFVAPLFLAEVTWRFFGFCGFEMMLFLGSNQCFQDENDVGGVGILWMVASLNICRRTGLVTHFLAYLILCFLLLLVFVCYCFFCGWCCLVVKLWLFISSDIRLLHGWCLVFIDKVVFT